MDTESLVQIYLKDPFLFPYPLRPVCKEGLRHIIREQKEQGLLIEFSSVYNISTNGGWYRTSASSMGQYSHSIP
jgi:hypothetical protein